eukprot:scaffold48492_cov19-Tisochrysis_lutea.AAC.1
MHPSNAQCGCSLPNAHRSSYTCPAQASLNLGLALLFTLMQNSSRTSSGRDPTVLRPHRFKTSVTPAPCLYLACVHAAPHLGPPFLCHPSTAQQWGAWRQ